MKTDIRSKLEDRRNRGKQGLNDPVVDRTGRKELNERPFIFVLFFIYLTIEFVRPQSFFPFIGVIRPALLVGIILAIFSLSNFSHDVFKDNSIRLLISFLALSAISVLYATNNFWAYQYTQTLALYVLAAIVPMCILVRSLDRLKKLMYFWIGAHTYLALYCMRHGGRGPGSFLADENDVAIALNVAIPFAYFFWQEKVLHGVGRWILGASLIVMVAGVVATESRGGFVGLVVTVGAVVWFSKRRLRNVILITLASGIFFLSIPYEYKAEILSINDTEDITRQDRIYSWERGWEMFLDNPIVGVGVGNYPWRVSEYELSSGANYGQRRMLGGRVAHSLYFTLLPETGIVGTLIVVLLVIQFFRRLGSSRRGDSLHLSEESLLVGAAARATMASMIGFLATAVFISVLYYPQMWYLFGFAYVISFMSRKMEKFSNTPAGNAN